MAARLKPHHQEEVKAKIQVSMLLDRLNKHLAGEVEMTSTQLKACEMMLDRALPRLQAVEQTIVEPERSESDILAELQALVSTNSDLIRSLLLAHDTVMDSSISSSSKASDSCTDLEIVSRETSS